MSHRHNRYPSLDATGTTPLTKDDDGKPRPDMECECCAKPATGFVNVRWGPMRGSDIDSYNVCARHLGMANGDGAAFKKFIIHLRTKDKFVAKTKPLDPPPAD